MPGMNGVETFEEMHRLYPALPVILMSGYSVEEVAERFGNADGSNFLQKPFLPSHLKETLRQLLT